MRLDRKRALNPSSRILIAGGDTLIGAALEGQLRAAGYEHVLAPATAELDLTDAGQVDDYFDEEEPEYVFFAAGKSGGIHANQRFPAELMRDNLLSAAHVIHSAHRHQVTKLLYLASSCSYPRLAPQPMRVESLWTGPLEPTNEAYAVAKLAGLKLCQAYQQQYAARFVTAIPANVFGPNDDFSPEDSHVIPGLIRRLHEAQGQGQAEFSIWGTGLARREFIYAPDLADACLFVMARYEEPEPINLGCGSDLSIAETARAIAEVVGYRGQLAFDTSKPDGMPYKALDSSKLLHLGWRPATDFRAALVETYAWFVEHVASEECKDVRTAV
jgi:GDP-L-fucose synthase